MSVGIEHYNAEFIFRNFSYNATHITGAELIARIAKEQGVEKFIHVSAMNASTSPEATVGGRTSGFLTSKVSRHLRYVLIESKLR